MGFKWSKFGKLKDTFEDGRYLYITNDVGQKRKISIIKYSTTIPIIRKKIALLRDRYCIIRTSQNSGDWSEEVWFSEISIDGSYQGIEQPAHELENDFESIETLTGKLELANRTIAQQKGVIASQRKSLMAKDEKIQDEKAKSNELKNELAEKELENSKLLAELNDEYNKLPHNQKNQIEEDATQLLQILNVDDIHEFQIKRNSHPRRELAFRIGIALPETKSRVAMKVLKHFNKNNWICELIDYDKQAIVSIGHGKGFYVKSFRNTKSSWFEAVEFTTKKPDEYFKDNLKLSLEELVEIHNKVCAKLV